MASVEELTRIYKARYASLTNELDSFIPLYTDIRNFLAPRTARFKGEMLNRGERQDLNILDISPRLAVRTLAAGLQSGVTSPLRPWFRLGTPDPALQEYAPVKLWLHTVEMLMREVMNRSNIYDRLKSTYGILGTYGTGAIGIDEDDEDVIRGTDFATGSFMIATSAAGRVNTLYRDVLLTSSQMIGKFAQGDMKRAKEILPSTVINNYANGNYEAKYPLVHIVEPNRNHRDGSALSKFKRFSSVWYDCARQGKESIYMLSGYDDIPIMAPRWDVLGEDVYGYGCGEIALGSAKALQLMEKRKLQGIDKNVNPPMVGDASLRNQRTTILPGETTYVSGLITGKQGFTPAYQVNPYLAELKEEIQRVEMMIDEAFYKNLFLMIAEVGDQPNITATQINTMREEKMLMLGPVLERLNDELLDPLIDRVFNIMLKRGMLPPPPKEIQGMPLRVEYISVLAQAQKAMGIGNIERFVGFVGNLAALQAQAGKAPTAFDKLDFDQTIDEYADGVSVPPTIVRSDDVVAEMRQAEQQQMQQAQQLQIAQQGAQAAKDLSQADTSGDNVLTRLMGGA